MNKEVWKKFEQNNKEIVLNVSFVRHNKKEIEAAYTSKNNYKRKKEVILLMITGGNNRWHYLAVKRLPTLLRGTTSNHHGNFYCFNCFHSYTILNKLKKYEKVCNTRDYCRVNMPKEHEKIKTLPGEKSLEVLFTDYAYLECLLKKCDLVNKTPKIFTQKKRLSINHRIRMMFNMLI